MKQIYEIRGQKVMLDKDLAEMYQVTTSNLNKSVKRNKRHKKSEDSSSQASDSMFKAKRRMVSK